MLFVGYYSRVEAIRRLIASFLDDAERLAAIPKRDSLQAGQAAPGVALAGSAEASPGKQPNADDTSERAERLATNISGTFAQVVNVGAGADTTAFFLAVSFR